MMISGPLPTLVTRNDFGLFYGNTPGVSKPIAYVHSVGVGFRRPCPDLLLPAKDE